MLELAKPADDDLIIPKVGSWSAQKHHFLRRYIDIFTTGMKNRAWQLHYIDLFAGAGMENVDGHGLDWGSPLIAAQANPRFAQLHLCELDLRKCDALKERIARFPQPSSAQVIQDDANKVVQQVVQMLDRNSLSLAFLDPHGLHLHFETLVQLAEKRVDLLIYFPDYLDARRNWDSYAQEENSNLDRVLGTESWRAIANDFPPDKWVERLLIAYKNRIGSLGYITIDSKRISLPRGQKLYTLLFCSKHQRGGEFWRKIASRERGGQQSLEYDD